MELFKDKTLICIKCGDAFVFSKASQEYFFKKALDVPKRCPKCRKIKREAYAKKKKRFLDELMIIENVKLEVVSAQ
jgi:hypothetical protein